MREPHYRLFPFLALLATVASAQSPPSQVPGAMLYIGTLSKNVLVLDEAQEKVVDKIPLHGTPRGLSLSYDKKKIYVNTWQDGIEVVDLASRKVVNHFVLDEANRKVRVKGFAPDPQDRVLYAVTAAVVKQVDRFEIEKPKFAVIDLAQQKMTKTVGYPKEEESPFGLFAGYRVSPDGKFLYVFRENVLIFDTADFKLVEKIDLSKPQPLYPGMATINLGGGDDPNEDPGILTQVFNASDPVVHNRIFGIAQVDLAKRTFDFTPVGPAATGMLELRLSPDRKIGYTVAFFGQHGTRRTELWVFDMAARKLVKRVEFPGRTRFNFAVSGNGRALYVYGAGPTVEIYDAATLQLQKVINLNADATTGMLVLRPRAS
ncbi:MAG: hypothetical protein HY236_10925 [Acidobacteria bacterium]|nr:hypothetical protein [Acidobacteriota bacterium]